MACCSHCSLSSSPLDPNLLLLYDPYKAPSASEATTLRNTVAAAEQELYDLQAAVEARTKLLERTIVEYRAMLAPVRLLPPELLAEIFVFADAPQIDSQSDSESVGEDTASLFDGVKRNIIHVSARWRTIALAHAPLWTRIHVSFKTTALRGRWESAPLVLAQQLEWSQSYPLQIRYGSHSPPLSESPATDTDRSGCFDLLLAHADRWAEVSFGLTGSEMKNFLESQATFSMLKRLELGPWSFAQLYDDPAGLAILSRCPQLRALPDLQVTNGNIHSIGSSIPLAQLEAIKVLGTPFFVMQTLGRLQQLQRVSIHAQGTFPEDFTQRTSCPKLHALRVLHQKIPTDMTPHLLDGVLAPALKKLRYDHSILDEHTSRSGAGPMILNFLASSQCFDLVRLQLNARIPLPSLLELLGVIPRLEHFIYTARAPLGDDFFQSLCLDDITHAGLVSSLTFLALAAEFTCQAEPVLKMLRTRRGTLRSTVICSRMQVLPDVVALTMKKEGWLEVSTRWNLD
ncbi:F-box domain-containing protein [Mycena chlorophos]|uniref:F-box domain-containing protein n=1 Tax=Mycena chlorophos TaxID=658473 RepID=A0A8H6RXH4_MYCCL|nr:F-box domain-containing protein [Mycena chlorophos]